MQDSLFPQTYLPGKVLAQRNDLVNARFRIETKQQPVSLRFHFNTIEMRLFTAMLARIKREDTEFQELEIPVCEILGGAHRRPGGKDYDALLRACTAMASCTVSIKAPGVTGRRKKQLIPSEEPGPSFINIPLMGYANYNAETGNIKARFNTYVRDHLLQLNEGNFTQVELLHLLGLKCTHSFRLYWLLKQYGEYGARTIALTELKCMLGLEGQYPKFTMFNTRVLKVAQAELSNTNLAFEYELLRGRGKGGVEGIRFTYSKIPGKHSLPPSGSMKAPSWMEALRSIEVSEASILHISQRIEQGDFDPTYVLFVVAAMKKRKQEGKDVDTVAGYVVSAIKNGYQFKQYQQRLSKLQANPQLADKKVTVAPVVISMADVRAGYDVEVKQKKTQEMFDLYLHRVYLSQGFHKEVNAIGIESVVKPG